MFDVKSQVYIHKNRLGEVQQIIKETNCRFFNNPKPHPRFPDVLVVFGAVENSDWRSCYDRIWKISKERNTPISVSYEEVQEKSSVVDRVCHYFKNLVK